MVAAMSRRTLRERQEGKLKVTTVETSDDLAGRCTYFEVHCGVCDDFVIVETGAELRRVVDEHTCEEP